MPQGQDMDIGQRTAYHGNGEADQNADFLDGTTSYTSSVTGTSVDPFDGKTNKFAESTRISIFSEGRVQIAWSSDGSTAAAAASPPLPAGRNRLAVPADKPYLRIRINGGGPNDVWVTELS